LLEIQPHTQDLPFFQIQIIFLAQFAFMDITDRSYDNGN